MGYKLPWSNFHELNLDWLLEEVRKLREDVNAITGSSTPSDDPPLMDGIADPGTASNYARGDHVHPTDTTRAADTDLAQEILDRDLADQGLAGDIAAVDAKIHFSSAAPAMDGVASPGSSDDQARADHVHPTDTSRASKSEFDTLKATVDGMSGSASPYDVNPQMDGVASYGTVGAYSRGDHVHPSDTSKLDTAGGTITGDLHINGDLQIDGDLISSGSGTYLESTSAGWYRVATIPTVKGTAVKIRIQKKGTSTPPESHDIVFYVNDNNVSFQNEYSKGDVLYLNAIRYTSAEAVDIHMDQNYASYVGIFLTPAASTEEDTAAIVTQTPSSVADAPVGETIEATYYFMQNHEEYIQGATPFTVGSSANDIYGGTSSYIYRKGNIVYGRVTPECKALSSGTWYTLATIDAAYRPSHFYSTIAVGSGSSTWAPVRIKTDGTVEICPTSSISNYTGVGINFCYPINL